MVEPVIIPTHDRTKTDSLPFPGEIRFGPPNFSPGIDKYRFHGRVYGDSCLGPPDSRYFAIQEWEAILEGRGLQTYLLIIDMEAKRERLVSKAELGFVVLLKFENNKLIF